MDWTYKKSGYRITEKCNANYILFHKFVEIYFKMTEKLIKILIAATFAALVQTSLGAQSVITTDVDQVLRPVGLMHGVGAGPGGHATVPMYRGAGIPFIRLHDISSSYDHCVDLIEIFPNFDADERKAESYDFAMTDAYIKKAVQTGAQIIWRLGNSHHEPSGIKKFGAWPPKDFKKWARICSHVVAHYNEGWADGFHYNIRYWEIWNEPDGDQGLLKPSENILPKDKDKVGKARRYEVAPHSWGGTMEEYYDLFSTTAKLLKKEHPDILIGGPANADFKYNEPFLKAMEERGVKIDFFSWHRYSRNPEALSKEGHAVRELLDRYGYQGLPTFLDEWNYVTSWDSDGAKYSNRVRHSIKGTAYTAACLCHMQNEACTDVMTYYDWRSTTTYNGAFDRTTGAETATYYVFFNWNKLLEYGSQIMVDCQQKDIYAVAAKDERGRVRMMLVRYNDDDSVFKEKKVSVAMPKGCSSYRVMLSDEYHMNTEYPVPEGKHGLQLQMKPNCVAFLEFE